jgi:hypothetical protein
MDGRNTPVWAQTQIMKLQKATDSGTPANPPQRDSVEEREKARMSAGAGVTHWEFASAGAGEIRHFKSTSAGISGAGFGAESVFFAHGQDSSPSQQPAGCAWAAHAVGASQAKQDGTWESWMTRPMSNPTIDLRFIPVMRVKWRSDYSKSFSLTPFARPELAVAVNFPLARSG